jgi:hypothetical protein
MHLRRTRRRRRISRLIAHFRSPRRRRRVALVSARIPARVIARIVPRGHDRPVQFQWRLASAGVTAVTTSNGRIVPRAPIAAGEMLPAATVLLGTARILRRCPASINLGCAIATGRPVARAGKFLPVPVVPALARFRAAVRPRYATLIVRPGDGGRCLFVPIVGAAVAGVSARPARRRTKPAPAAAITVVAPIVIGCVSPSGVVVAPRRWIVLRQVLIGSGSHAARAVFGALVRADVVRAIAAGTPPGAGTIVSAGVAGPVHTRNLGNVVSGFHIAVIGPVKAGNFRGAVLGFRVRVRRPVSTGYFRNVGFDPPVATQIAPLHLAGAGMEIGPYVALLAAFARDHPLNAGTLIVEALLPSRRLVPRVKTLIVAHAHTCGNTRSAAR